MIQEIKTMYAILTGSEISDWELKQMTHKQLRDLHSELNTSYREEMEIDYTYFGD